LAFLLAWGLDHLFPRLSAPTRCWYWRLAYLKLIIALLWSVPLRLPLLPAAGPMSPAPLGGEPALVPATMKIAIDGVQASPGESSAEFMSSCHPIEWLFIAWMLGVAVCGTRLFLDWRRTLRMQRSSQPVRNTNLLAQYENLSGSRRIPTLLLTPHLTCPVLVGVIRPAILL